MISEKKPCKSEFGFTMFAFLKQEQGKGTVTQSPFRWLCLRSEESHCESLCDRGKVLHLVSRY